MAEMILVVDDDPAIQMTLQFLLEDRGYEVMVASDSQDGLEHLKKRQADLVIRDRMMPRMAGRAFAAQLHQGALQPPVPIMLTADGRAQQEAAEVGASGYVEKPFGAQWLVNQVSRLPAGGQTGESEQPSQ